MDISLVTYVCRIQNLHISQTDVIQGFAKLVFVEFKIYISLKQYHVDIIVISVCRIQNLHISQTPMLLNDARTGVCRIQNLHISQTSN